MEVHEVTRESDDYFLALTSMELPESQRDQYGYLHIGTLEVVQVAALGSDRLLAAAVLVGPSGRSLLNMGDDERDEFETRIREARFYLADATARAELVVEEAGRAAGGLSLR